jgi:hypothetical protein
MLASNTAGFIMKRYAIGTLALLFSTLCLASSGYEYPIDNALAATVIGTPKDYYELVRMLYTKKRELDIAR